MYNNCVKLYDSICEYTSYRFEFEVFTLSFGAINTNYIMLLKFKIIIKNDIKEQKAIYKIV